MTMAKTTAAPVRILPTRSSLFAASSLESSMLLYAPDS